MHFVILIIFGNIRVWILRGFCVDFVWIFGGYDNKSLSVGILERYYLLDYGPSFNRRYGNLTLQMVY
ncbi:unnamed protein product [Rhizophagus irregularis]|nr:unnamed protein product [Rhizophagus irregularis]